VRYAVNCEHELIVHRPFETQMAESVTFMWHYSIISDVMKEVTKMQLYIMNLVLTRHFSRYLLFRYCVCVQTLMSAAQVLITVKMINTV